MKFVILFIALFLSIGSFAQNQNLRQELDQAEKSKKAAEAFMKKLQNTSAKTASIDGYTAMTHFILARETSNPFTRMKHFREGKELLEKTIKQEPNQLEWRFYRYMVQDGAPAMLGYKDQLSTDLQFIRNNISKADADLQKRIKQNIKL
ncbi:MAG: hypothetical protein Q4F57_00775 [Weeksellaceae bacterium]|nr:hypothetical protein [Weeksellaceae bacterium]